jgi:ankyrin repeat protein
MLLRNAIINNRSIEYISKLIKDYNIDVNNKIDGMTPLHIASRYNNYDVCKLIIDCGAHLNINDNYNNTPLCIASNNCNNNICKLLIDNGADINIECEDGYTALQWSGSYNTFKVLINQGAKYNILQPTLPFFVNDCNKFINKIELFKSNIYKLTSNGPIKYYFINNILLVKLLSKSKVIYHNTNIPKLVIWLIGSYFFY